MVVSVKSRLQSNSCSLLDGFCIIFALFLVRRACSGLDTCSDLCLARRKHYNFLKSTVRGSHVKETGKSLPLACDNRIHVSVWDFCLSTSNVRELWLTHQDCDNLIVVRSTEIPDTALLLILFVVVISFCILSCQAFSLVKFVSERWKQKLHSCLCYWERINIKSMYQGVLKKRVNQLCSKNFFHLSVWTAHEQQVVHVRPTLGHIAVDIKATFCWTLNDWV